jgi:hypothetical protein
MDFKETGCEDLNSIGLAWDKDKWRALVNKAKNFEVTQNADDFLTCCGNIMFSRRALVHAVS